MIIDETTLKLVHCKFLELDESILNFIDCNGLQRFPVSRLNEIQEDRSWPFIISNSKNSNSTDDRDIVEGPDEIVEKPKKPKFPRGYDYDPYEEWVAESRSKE